MTPDNGRDGEQRTGRPPRPDKSAGFAELTGLVAGGPGAR
jgi:hypothetical protein